MDYTLKISPRMLELLSKHLYSNIYFVLGELIANAYDADAENVYVFIDDNLIKVEDDGSGMTPTEINDIYLMVGHETRNSSDNARTPIKNRLKMGRKGIGKLAALSISDGFQLITIKNNVSTGIYVPNSIQKDNEILRELSANEYSLDCITDHGTAVIMNSPKIKIPLLAETVTKNLSKIFPKIAQDFNIFVIYKGKKYSVEPDEKKIAPKLVSLVTIGDSHTYLKDYFRVDNLAKYENINEKTIDIKMLKSDGTEGTIALKIYGWIGAYESTRDMKKEISEFSDNYLAIFSHEKLGQRNVLDIVSKNRLYENYIVGNLYIDAFEDPDYPDMASTNRQGYNEEDPRWKAALSEIRKYVDMVVGMRTDYANASKAVEEKKKYSKQLEKEKELNDAVKATSESLSKKIDFAIQNNEDATEVATEVINEFRKTIGLKAMVDTNKKKIIISQTLMDKAVSDIIYKMLLFNGVPKSDIIYSNSSDFEANIPDGDVYGYLRDFFVNSASDEKIYVLFVTSQNIFSVNDDESIKNSWGVMMEIGATWITQKDHAIFNLDGFVPREPMNVRNKIVELRRVVNDETINISLSEANCNAFVEKIIKACLDCGYSPKDEISNKEELIQYVDIFDPAL